MSRYYSYSMNSADTHTRDLSVTLSHRDLATTFEAVVLFQPAASDSQQLLREASRILAEAAPGEPFEMSLGQLQAAREAVDAYCRQIAPHRRSRVGSTAEAIDGSMLHPSDRSARPLHGA
jgi:cytochrome P450